MPASRCAASASLVGRYTEKAMSQPLLTVVAEFVAKPGNEEDVRKLLLSLIAPTRQEEGCVQYDLHEQTDKPGHFLFYENWTSREALDRHLQTPHLTAAVGAAAALVAEPIRVVTCARIA